MVNPAKNGNINIKMNIDDFKKINNSPSIESGNKTNKILNMKKKGCCLIF